MPAVPGWMIMAVDLDQILTNYCVSSAPGARTSAPKLHTLKVNTNYTIMLIIYE